jgi:nicotinate-nucleotide--dimethylbenzimidazole phosphoribosyltransferase
MLANFARGGAAINVLARHAGAQLVVVDMGVAHRPAGGLPPEVRDARIAPGTANFTRGPAMTRAQAVAAVAAGARLAGELADGGVGLLAIGDMGIGNTTSASALASLFSGASPEEVTGRGTGIDDATLHRKIDVIRRGLAVNQPSASDPVGALAAIGGFEIAGLAGVALGAAAARVAVVVDGFIASVAALAAARIAPLAAGYLIASHRSVEAGHRLVLQALGQQPLLDLDLRLGEGTGAALAMTLADAALKILGEMATFADAGVTNTGR